MNKQENKHRLFKQFARIQWLLHRHRQNKLKTYGPMGDPHRGQGRILTLLKMQPEISQKELSYLLNIRPQSLGELLAKLERNGYITRTPSDQDRRVMNIKLTEEGAKMAEQKPKSEKLFDCLNEEEKDTLSEYLNRIITSLKEKVGDEQPDCDFEMYQDMHGINSLREFHRKHMHHHRRGFFTEDDPRYKCFDRSFDRDIPDKEEPSVPPKKED